MSVFRAHSSPHTDWSVPKQRGPHPRNAQFTYEDSATERLRPPLKPFAEGPEPHHHRSAELAMVLAALAIVVSGGANLIAWHALRRADTVAATPSVAPITRGPVAAFGSTLYAEEPLQMEVACGGSARIDLDVRPRLHASQQQSDLRSDNRCGSAGTLFFAGPGARASHVKDPHLDRPGCADAMTASPLEGGEGVPVVRGTVLCVATAHTLARVEVSAVGADGTASLWATGWTAPSESGGPDTVVPSVGASPGG